MIFKSVVTDALLEVDRRQKNGVCCAGKMGQARTLTLPEVDARCLASFFFDLMELVRRRNIHCLKHYY
jgi:hypothetical protein